MTKAAYVFGATIVFALACTNGRPQRSAADVASARAFVQRFYAWYVPMANGPHTEPAMAIALRERRSWFSVELADALSTDIASDTVPGEAVGVGYDPFLQSQDPCERYDASDATTVGDRVRVTVTVTCGERRLDRAGAITEVRAAGPSWEFVNFYNADGKDGLLADLKRLAAERKRSVR